MWPMSHQPILPGQGEHTSQHGELTVDLPVRRPSGLTDTHERPQAIGGDAPELALTEDRLQVQTDAAFCLSDAASPIRAIIRQQVLRRLLERNPIRPRIDQRPVLDTALAIPQHVPCHGHLDRSLLFPHRTTAYVVFDPPRREHFRRAVRPSPAASVD